MHIGRFFIRHEKSSLLNNYELFFYLPIVGDKKGSRFPVFISFHNEQINFHFDGLISKTKNNDKNDDEKKDDEKKVENYEIQENILFTLDLHPDKETQHKLNKTLKQLFNKQFPISDTYKISTFKEQSNNKCSEHENKNGVKTYKCLSVFERKNENENEDKNGYIYFRELLLDFLFDVYHYPEVFATCKKFERIKYLLGQSVFIQAILRKAEFYYQVENYQKFSTFNFSYDNYKEDLTKAHKDWFYILQEEGNNNIINAKNKWFKDVETEVQRALEKSNGNLKNKTKNNKDENSENKRPNNKQVYESSKKKFIKSYLNIKADTVEWYIKRNNILRAWLVFDKMKVIFYLVLTMVLYLVFSIIVKTNNFKQVEIGYYWDLANGTFNIYLISLLGIIIYSILYGLFHYYKKEKWKLYFKKFPKLLLKFFMVPFWMLISGSAYIVFELTSNYNDKFVFNEWTYTAGSVIIVAIILILFYKLFYKLAKTNLAKLVNIYKKNKKIRYFIFVLLLLLLLLLSILCYIYCPNQGLTVFFLIFFTTIIILYYNEKENHPNLEVGTRLNKTFSMYFYGLVISLVVNLGVYHTYYKDFLEKEHYLGYIWEQVVFENEAEMEEVKNKETHLRHSDNLYYVYKKHDATIFDSIKEKSKEPLTDEIYVYIDRHFFDELTHVYVTKKDIAERKEINNLEKAGLFPVLREIDINGFKFITIPSVLFINTLLTLLVAVVLQILFHKRKFLLGGEAE